MKRCEGARENGAVPNKSANNAILANIQQTWVVDVGSNALNQLFKNCATFQTCVFQRSKGRGLNIFSLAPFAYLEPPFICASVLNL